MRGNVYQFVGSDPNELDAANMRPELEHGCRKQMAITGILLFHTISPYVPYVKM